jgi:predicted NBD/HSP70 family sugar kinase
MAKTIGVVMTEAIRSGLVDDHKITGDQRRFPESMDEFGGLIEFPADALSESICDEIKALIPEGTPIDAIGVAMPGIIRNGVVEDSPNLPQLKGARVTDAIESGLRTRGINNRVSVFNDADAVAAGVAATRGHLDRLIRVWTIGNGIGFGRYPYADGPWEGGHSIITLDPKENYCGCGGRGHLEGIMGHRAMRLRFLDLEPDEVFAAAKKGDKRCMDFVERYHRALAAATATQIHIEGPGRFYLTGRDIQRLDITLLKQYLYEMVKMSPLQSYTLEVLPEDPTLGIIGSGIAAEQALSSYR